MTTSPNIDKRTVDGFGDEWKRFDQSTLSELEHRLLFERYFSIFPWDDLPSTAVGFDLGCGSGRWAKLVAPRVGHLHCIDPSTALVVARKNLALSANCSFHTATVEHLPLLDDSMDFGYSLGVLHHIPDTQAGLAACIKKLKPGAPFLLYLYYAFDNRPLWFRAVWMFSDLCRRVICRLPNGFRHLLCDVLAIFAYWPLARIAWVMERIGNDVKNYPLSTYRHLSFYTMRTDALDRFGTRLEQRFSMEKIEAMMKEAGLVDVKFSSNEP